MEIEQLPVRASVLRVQPIGLNPVSAFHLEFSQNAAVRIKTVRAPFQAGDLVFVKRRGPAEPQGMSGVAERIFAYAVIILLEMPALHGSEMPDVFPAFRIGGHEVRLAQFAGLMQKKPAIGNRILDGNIHGLSSVHRKKEDKILFLQGKTK